MICTKCGTNNNQDAKFCCQCGCALGSIQDGVSAEGVSSVPYTKYAGFWIRFLALIIDVFLLVIVCFALIFVFISIRAVIISYSDSTGEEAHSSVEWLHDFLIYLAGPWLWCTLFESSRLQGTPGKSFLGLKVTDEAGRRIGYGRANARFWSKYLLSGWLFIGFIMVAFSTKKQSLHDLIARTVVVHQNTKQN